MTDQLTAWADALVQQIASGARFEPPWEPGAVSLADGYAIQDLVAERLEAARGPIAGYKVAVTAAPLQEMLRIDHPLGGVVHGGQIRESGAAMASEGFVSPAVECELVIRIGRDVPGDAPGGGRWDRASIAAHVGEVITGFEIIDPRAAELPTMGAAALVADRCACEGAVLGSATSGWSDLDLSSSVTELEWNGEVVDHGVTGAAMGHPFEGLAWLANHLNERGRELREGDLVLTGAVFAPRPAVPGDRFTFRVEGIGSVSARLE